MATGGTIAPGARESAAAMALGAPKVVSVKAQKTTPGKMPRPAKATLPRFLNKANGQMETRAAMRNYRAPAPRPGGQRPAAKLPAQAAPAQLNLGGNTPQEITQISRQHANQTLKAELAPLNSQGHEITQNEQGAAQRYTQDANQTAQFVGGLATGQEASAKTAENHAADSALQANKANENTAQTQAGLLGGSSPELRSLQTAGAAQAQATGAAGQTYAHDSGLAGVGLLQGIRGAAALQALQGQGKISSYFQKQQNQVGAARTAAIARVGQNQAREEGDLNQKNFTDNATRQSLGLKTIETGNKTAATQSRIAREQAETSQGQQRINQAASKQTFDEWSKRESLKIQNLSAQDKHRYDTALLRSKEHPASPKEGHAYMQKLATAATIAKAQGVHSGKKGASLQEAKKKAEEAMVTAAKGGTINREIVEAAFNLAYYGRLSTADQAVAFSYGLTPQIRPEWFRH